MKLEVDLCYLCPKKIDVLGKIGTFKTGTTTGPKGRNNVCLGLQSASGRAPCKPPARRVSRQRARKEIFMPFEGRRNPSN